MDGLVSIIMPVKNGLPYLEDCLRSIIPQTYGNWELLVIDDHSSDETWQTISNYAVDDSRIKPLKNPGTGIVDALNFGYANSNGEYITRMDADDLMSPDKLELMLSKAGQGKLVVGLVEYFADYPVGEGYRKYAQWLNDLTATAGNFADIYKECPIPSACWMCERSDFERVGGFGSNYPEDYDLAFRFYGHKLEVVSVLEVLHRWRDHGTRASRNDPNYADNRFFELKMKHFLSIDRSTDPLVLIGAGKKGKRLAQILLKQSIDFEWWTNNPKKTGIDIYGLFPVAEGDKTGKQIIVTVAGEEGGKLKVKYPDACFFC